ncbi:MAG: hypothetical protein RL670_1308 [Actinomycetota bacterium]
MAQLRVGLLAADDDVRAGRAQMLDSLRDFRVVFEEADGEMALRRLPEATVDMLLVNHRLRSIDGLTTIQRICDQLVEVPLLIATGPYASPELTVEAAKAGALATVTMDVGAAELVATMRRVRDFEDQKELPRLVEAFAQFKRSGGVMDLGQRDFGDLSQKQRQMISLYAQGLSDAQSLQKLRIVAESQAKQLAAIFSKLKLRTRSQLVLVEAQMPKDSNE